MFLILIFFVFGRTAVVVSLHFVYANFRKFNRWTKISTKQTDEAKKRAEKKQRYLLKLRLFTLTQLLSNDIQVAFFSISFCVSLSFRRSLSAEIWWFVRRIWFWSKIRHEIFNQWIEVKTIECKKKTDDKNDILNVTRKFEIASGNTVMRDRR